MTNTLFHCPKADDLQNITENVKV